MRYIFSIIKSLFFWSYSRTTWQYDVLCALILAFIFLTPKSWFETGELRSTRQHQRPVASVLLIDPETVTAEMDRAEIERRVRTLTNRPDARVTGMRQKLDAQGKILAYEVDIQ